MIDPIDLHAFVDGELSPQQEAAVRSSLRGSPEVAREAEAIRSLKAALATKLEAPAAGQSWKKCVKRLDELDKTKQVEKFVGRFAPAACAALFVGILLVGRFAGHRYPGTVSGPDLARMFGSMAPDRQPSRWLDTLIKQSFQSTPDHLTVRGVKSGSIEGLPVRCFSCRDANGNLSILVFPQPLVFEGMAPMADHPNIKVGTLDGVNCVAWTQGGRSIILAAERKYVDLATVAAEVTVR